MKGTGAKRNVCPGSCVSTGAKFPVAPVESAPMHRSPLHSHRHKYHNMTSGRRITMKGRIVLGDVTTASREQRKRDFSTLKMAAVRHFGFVRGVLGSPKKSTCMS